jgi:lysophospholipase L1-like esterase
MVNVKPGTQSTGSGPVVRTVTAVLFAVSLLLLAWGLLHESCNPVLFGRYSPPYLAFLLALLGVAVILGYAFWSRSPRLASALSNLYLLLFSTSLILLVTELALRAFNPWGIDFFHMLPYHMQGMVDHPTLGYVHPRSVTYSLGRNTVTLNSHGLRDEEIPYEKPAGERRILVLGDSVAFGWGVDQGDTFSDRMEPRLKQLTGGAWQVINAGVNGYTSEQELEYLSIEGLRYSPDIVVLLYVGNDLAPVLDPNVTTWRRYPSWPSSLPEALSRLPALSFLYQSTNLFGRMRVLEDQPGARRSITQDPRWPESRNAVDEMAKLCASKGIVFLLVAELNDPVFLEEMRRIGIDPITLSAPYEQVKKAGRPTTVSRVDSHPSAAAHDAFAEHIVEALAARGWLGTKPVARP